MLMLPRRLTANPLIAQQIQQARGFSWPMTLAFGLTITLVTNTGLAWLASENEESLIIWIVIIAVIVTAVTPAMTAAIAAIITSNALQTKQHDMLSLTGISDRDIVEGYVWVALHRLRVPLALAISVASWRVVVPGAITVFLFSDNFGTSIVLWLLALLIIVLNTAGLLYMAATIGVEVVLKRRVLAAAIPLASVYSFLYQQAWFLVTLVILYLIGALTVEAASAVSRLFPLALFVFAVVVALLLLKGLHIFYRESIRAIRNSAIKFVRAK